MDRAIVVNQQGGPEVLEWTHKDPGEPGPGEVLEGIRFTAAPVTGLVLIFIPDVVLVRGTFREAEDLLHFAFHGGF